MSQPFAYAYRYPGGAVFFANGAEPVNGAAPVEAIPLYTQAQLDAERAKVEALEVNENAARTARAKAAVYRIALDGLIANNEITEEWHRRNNKPYLNVALDKARQAIKVLEGVNAPGECLACNSSGEVETVAGETVACPYCLSSSYANSETALTARATAAEAEAERLREAMRQCPHDGGFDRELGPVGCHLAVHGLECVCAGIFAALTKKEKPDAAE